MDHSLLFIKTIIGYYETIIDPFIDQYKTTHGPFIRIYKPLWDHYETTHGPFTNHYETIMRSLMDDL